MALPVTFPPLFNIYHSAATQCGPFSVTWVAAGSSVLSGPPFTLLILPFDAEPIALQLPDSSYDTTRRAGSFTLNRLWLEKGTQFIISMDDTTDLRSGRTIGDVSLIQTVGESPDATCLFSEPGSAPWSNTQFITLNPAIPSQCSVQDISWNSTISSQPPNIRGYIPGGQAFALETSASKSVVQQGWVAMIREGTQVVLLVGLGRTSPLLTVTGKSSQGDSCLNANSPSATVPLDPTMTPSTTVSLDQAMTPSTTVLLPEATKSPENGRVRAIVGGVIGGIVFIAIICTAIALYRSFTRKVKIRNIKDPFENTGAQAVPPGAIAYTTSAIVRKPPLNTQGRREHPPPPRQPPGKSAAPIEPLSIVSLTGVGLLESRQRPNIAHGAQGEPREAVIHTHSDASTGQHHNGESEQLSSSMPAHNWSLSTLPAPPARHNSSQGPPLPLTIPSVDMHAAGIDDENDEGETVGEEYAFGARRGLSVRVRMEGISGRRRSRENVIGTAYLTHTDAGVVRVIELPPSYNDLRFQPAHQESTSQEDLQ